MLRFVAAVVLGVAFAITGLTDPALAQSSPDAPGVGVGSEGTAVMTCVRFSPDGTRLASIDKQNRIAIWDVATGALQTTVRGQNEYVYRLDWSPDGTRIATASKDGTIGVWDVETGERLHQFGNLSGASNRTAGGATEVKFSPDGRHVAGMQVFPSGEVVVWRLEDEAEVLRLKRPRPIGNFDWSSDGATVYTAEFDGKVYAWSFPDGASSGAWRLDSGRLVGLAVRGSQLATGGVNDRLHLFDLDRGTTQASFDHDGFINTVAWSADGSFVAGSDATGHVKVWDVPTGTLRFERRAHTGVAYTLDVDSTGRYVATGGQDSIIRLWSASDGTLIRTIRGTGL